MKLLVVGGSGFLSSSIVDHALLRNHEVSTLQRNATGRKDVNEIIVDICDKDDLENKLSGHNWDCVIDIGPKTTPRIVKQVLESLKQSSIQHYTFISSIGAYASFSNRNIDENNALAELEDPTNEELSSKTFGALKVACEKEIQNYYKDTSLIIRPGLIIGPTDKSGRFAYWIERFIDDNEDIIIAPHNPDWPAQAIDVRDLSVWIIQMIENRETGVYNAVNSFTMGDLISECREISSISKNKNIKWIDNDKLLSAGVIPFSGLPMWVPESMIGLATVNSSKAIAKGLQFKSLKETIQDTHAWLSSIDNHETLKESFWKPVGGPKIGITLEQKTILQQ